MATSLCWEPESAAGPFGPACFTASSSGLLLGAAGGLEGGDVEHALVANAAGLRWQTEEGLVPRRLRRAEAARVGKLPTPAPRVRVLTLERRSWDKGDCWNG